MGFILKQTVFFLCCLACALVLNGCATKAGGPGDLVVEMPKGGPPPDGQGRYKNSLGMEFVWIAPGSFEMGSPPGESGPVDSEQQHPVTLTQGYYMQTKEVTQGQWRALMGSNPSELSDFGDNCPVDHVSWGDVQAFISKLNSRGEGVYRLPTEAEWEYAARAGTTTAWPWGDDPDQVCRYANVYDQSSKRIGGFHQSAFECDDGFAIVAPVGSFKPNAWGLYDMIGNALEWCQDRYGNYSSGPMTDPTGASSGSGRVGRGGSWFHPPDGCLLTNREWIIPGFRLDYLGFRLALSPVR